jgi:hypothetical protein
MPTWSVIIGLIRMVTIGVVAVIAITSIMIWWSIIIDITIASNRCISGVIDSNVFAIIDINIYIVIAPNIIRSVVGIIVIVPNIRSVVGIVVIISNIRPVV